MNTILIAGFGIGIVLSIGIGLYSGIFNSPLSKSEKLKIKELTKKQN